MPTRSDFFCCKHRVSFGVHHIRITIPKSSDLSFFTLAIIFSYFSSFFKNLHEFLVEVTPRSHINRIRRLRIKHSRRRKNHRTYAIPMWLNTFHVCGRSRLPELVTFLYGIFREGSRLLIKIIISPFKHVSSNYLAVSDRSLKRCLRHPEIIKLCIQPLAIVIDFIL